jgi:hypothetical protein
MMKNKTLIKVTNINNQKSPWDKHSQRLVPGNPLFGIWPQKRGRVHLAFPNREQGTVGIF